MMEEAVNVQKREDNFDKKTLPSSIPIYLIYVFFCDAYSWNREAGENSKALSMGRNWGHQKITLGGLESGLLSTEKGWIGWLEV